MSAICYQKKKKSAHGNKPLSKLFPLSHETVDKTTFILLSLKTSELE